MFFMPWVRSIVALQKPTAQNPCRGYQLVPKPSLFTCHSRRSKRLPVIKGDVPPDNEFHFADHHSQLGNGIVRVRRNGQALRAEDQKLVTCARERSVETEPA
jgi:hypothetical protein